MRDTVFPSTQLSMTGGESVDWLRLRETPHLKVMVSFTTWWIMMIQRLQTDPTTCATPLVGSRLGSDLPPPRPSKTVQIGMINHSPVVGSGRNDPSIIRLEIQRYSIWCSRSTGPRSRLGCSGHRLFGFFKWDQSPERKLGPVHDLGLCGTWWANRIFMDFE